jgi:mannose-1-phosphate guanylyltransferase
MAIHRLDPIIPLENTLILTIQEQAELLGEQVPGLTDENFVLEPGPRGTASVIGLAAMQLKRRDPDAIMACLTADHYIPGVEAFQHLLRAGYEVASEGYIVTLGIPPTGPDTGYGYIHRGKPFSITDLHPQYEVKTFTEKPDSATAVKYLQRGDYLWNSGMFIWHVDTILSEIEQQLPKLFSSLEVIDKAFGTSDEAVVLKNEWSKLDSITVDYGIMEGAEKVVVLPANDLGWVDIGDWSRLFEILSKDEDGNVTHSQDVLLDDCKDTLIFQDADGPTRLIAGIGLEDFVVVDTGSVLLLCPKSRSDEVKHLIAKLREANLERYL